MAELIEDVLSPRAVAMGEAKANELLSSMIIGVKGRPVPAASQCLPCHRRKLSDATWKTMPLRLARPTGMSHSPFANHDRTKGGVKEMLLRHMSEQELENCADAALSFVEDGKRAGLITVLECFCWDMHGQAASCASCRMMVPLASKETHRCKFRVESPLLSLSSPLPPPKRIKVKNVNWRSTGNATLDAPHYFLDPGLSAHVGEREGEWLLSVLRAPLPPSLVEQLGSLASALYCRYPHVSAVKGALPHRAWGEAVTRSCALRYDYEGHLIEPVSQSGWAGFTGSLTCLREFVYQMARFCRCDQEGFAPTTPTSTFAIVAFNFQSTLQAHTDRECVYRYDGDEGRVAWEPAAQVMVQLAFLMEGKQVPVTLILRTNSALHAGAPWVEKDETLSHRNAQPPRPRRALSLPALPVPMDGRREVLKTLKLTTGVRPFEGAKVNVFPAIIDGKYRAAVLSVPQAKGDCVINWASSSSGASMNTCMSHEVFFRKNKRVGIGGRAGGYGVKGDVVWKIFA